MTYIAGIRRRDHVFLVSDSAVTHIGRARRTGHEQVTTSFGEAQILETLKTVQEGALKLHHLGQVAVAVAGDAGQANRFISILKTALDGGAAASEQTFSESIASLKDRDDLAFQFIATLAVQPAPSLFSFNMGGERKLLQHFGEGVVQAGSPTEFQTELFRTVLKLLDERLPPRPEVFLVAAVAWLQSIGVREYLLDSGIGGAFYGLYADAQNINWQSDVTVGIHHRMSSPALPVITIIRDNVVLVRSGLDEASRAMYSSTSSEVTIAGWYARWGSFDDAVLASAIRFVVLIDTVDWSVAVFELAEDGSSRYLRFEGPTRRSDGRIQVAVSFAPEVLAILEAPIRPADSPSGTPIFFAWSPADADPKIVRFVIEPRF